MMKNRKEKKCRCILLLVLFLSFFGSNLFFNHSHIVDGNILVHSHPFKADKDGKPLHNHNNNSYVLIHILNNFVTTPAIIILIAAISFLTIRALYLLFENSSLAVNPGLLFRKRGPPSTDYAIAV